MCYFSKDKEPTETRIYLPADIFKDCPPEEDETDTEEEKHYKFSRIRQDPNNECFKRALELYGNYDNMDKEE